MALSFCLFNFIYLLKKKIHSSCFSSHFVSVFLPCGCVAQAGTLGNCPKLELWGSSKKAANLNAAARSGVVPVLAHTEHWLQGCRRRRAGRRNTRRLTEGLRNLDLSPTACWPACHHLNGTSDFSLAQRFNIKAKIRHSVEAPSNLWHNSNNNNNKKLLYT